MKSLKLLAIPATLLLAGGLALAAPLPSSSNTMRSEVARYQADSTAPGTKANKNTGLHQVSGTVSSVSPSQLVLLHKHMGREERTTFEMNSATRRQGKIQNGAVVVVNYRITENNKNIATRVKAEPPKE